MEITGCDGEFVVPYGADDVRLKILATVLAARFSIKESDLSAELDAVRRPQIDNVVDLPTAGHIREGGALRLPGTERWQKFLRRAHRTESGREEETISVFK